MGRSNHFKPMRLRSMLLVIVDLGALIALVTLYGAVSRPRLPRRP